MKKIYYLEYLRAIATIAVIATHIFTTARTDFIEHSVFENFISLYVVQILHFCVPIFLMITGSLFLAKEKNISIKEMYKKYIYKYVLVLLIFGYTFCLIEYYFNNGFKIEMFFKSAINLILGHSWEHMWYLYMLIGLLMTLPIIKAIYNILREKKELLKYFVVISVLSCFIYPMVKEMFGITIPITIPLFSNYVTYLIIGRILEEKIYSISNAKSLVLIGICVLVLLISNIFDNFLEIHFLEALGQYNSIVILVLSVSLFCLFKNNENRCYDSKIIKCISKYSFPSYILHMFWVNILYKFIGFNIYGTMFFTKTIIAFAFVIICTYISSFVCKKMPVLKNIL